MIKMTDVAFFEVRHDEKPLSADEDGDYVDVVEVRSDVYHQPQRNSYYGTICGKTLHDGVQTMKELAAKFLPPCVDGCWLPEDLPLQSTSSIAEPEELKVLT